MGLSEKVLERLHLSSGLGISQQSQHIEGVAVVDAKLAGSKPAISKLGTTAIGTVSQEMAIADSTEIGGKEELRLKMSSHPLGKLPYKHAFHVICAIFPQGRVHGRGAGSA